MTGRSPPRILFIGGRSTTGRADPGSENELQSVVLADAGYCVRVGSRAARPQSGMPDDIALVVASRSWADAIVVDAFAGRRFWTPFVVARIARVFSQPAIIALRDEALPQFAGRHPRRVGSTLRMATRVLTGSRPLQRHFEDTGIPIGLQPDLAAASERGRPGDEVLRSWDATLTRCGVNREAAPDTGCGPLGLRDLDEVVAIHRAAFPDSAITQLGDPVIRRYYLWQFIGPHPTPVALGVWHEGRLVGFLFGGLRQRAVVGFVHRYVGAIAVGAVRHPGAVRRLAAPKVMAVARLLARNTVSRSVGPVPAVVRSDPDLDPVSGPDLDPVSVEVGPSFGVLSVAVAGAARGTGAAVRLMAEAEGAATALGFARMHLTVQPENGRAIAFYEKLGWARKAASDGWQGAMTKAIVGVAVATGGASR